MSKIQKNRMVQARKEIYYVISANELSPEEGAELLRHIFIEIGHKTQETQLRESWERIKKTNGAENDTAEEQDEDNKPTPDEPDEVPA